MTSIYRESFRYFLVSLPALVGFAALIEVLLWVLQPKREFTVTFVALIFIAYLFHRHFLFGEALSLTQKPKADAPPLKFGWFILASTLIILGPVALSFLLALGFLDRPATGIVVLTFLAIYLVTLSLFGTILPATVARDNTYRIGQGVRATFATMWRLVLGPGVLGFAILLIITAINNTLERFAVPEDSLLTLAAFVLVRTLGFLTTILAVAVLCEMYRKTRPEPRLPQGPGTLDQTPA